MLVNFFQPIETNWYPHTITYNFRPGRLDEIIKIIFILFHKYKNIHRIFC